MSEPNNMRWQFRVVELPKPTRSGVMYRWAFIAMGMSVGMAWEWVLTNWLGTRWGSRIMWLCVAGLAAWQAVYIQLEQRRVNRTVQEMRRWANHHVGPELPEESIGDVPHREE